MATNNSTIIFGKKVIESLPTPETGKRKVYSDKKTQYLFLRVTPSARTFFWQKRISGAQKTITIGKFPSINAEQARDKADWIAAQYTQGVDVQATVRESHGGMTLGELWADFRLNRARGRGLISTTLEYIWNRHFKHWKDKPVSSISFDMSRKLILAIRVKTPIHANRVQRLGKALMNHGIKELRLKIENPFLFAQVSEKGRSRKDYRLHRADMPKFLKALDSLEGTNMKVLFLMALFTGRRIGEIKSCRWVDLDLTSGLWVIPNTKSGESQTCVLPRPLIDILSVRERESEWVFPAYTKTKHVQFIGGAWKHVRAHGFQHLQARDLRGTLASFMQESGMPIIAASQQLGHSSVEVTAAHYSSISDSLQRLGMDSAVAAMLEVEE